MPKNFTEWTTLISNLLCIVATMSNLIAIRMLIKNQAKEVVQGLKRL